MDLSSVETVGAIVACAAIFRTRRAARRAARRAEHEAARLAEADGLAAVDRHEQRRRFLRAALSDVERAANATTVRRFAACARGDWATWTTGAAESVPVVVPVAAFRVLGPLVRANRIRHERSVAPPDARPRG